MSEGTGVDSEVVWVTLSPRSKRERRMMQQPAKAILRIARPISQHLWIPNTITHRRPSVILVVTPNDSAAARCLPSHAPSLPRQPR